MPAAAAIRHTKTRGMIITALDLLRLLLLLILCSSLKYPSLYRSRHTAAESIYKLLHMKQAKSIAQPDN